MDLYNIFQNFYNSFDAIKKTAKKMNLSQHIRRINILSDIYHLVFGLSPPSPVT